MVRPADFIKDRLTYLNRTSRSPHLLTTDSSFTKDFEQIFKSVVKKSQTHEYMINGFKFSETKQVDIRLVDAKGSFFDLIAFVSIASFVVLLQFACRYVGFSFPERTVKTKQG